MELKQGERFTDGNGDACRMLAYATDLKDGSRRPVYQKLSGDLEYFIGDATDTKKPLEESFSGLAEVETREIFEGEVNPHLLAFLEADTVEEKLEALSEIKDTEDEKLLTALEASMDITGTQGSPEERLAFLRHTLQTKARFEGSRLRG